MEKNEQIKESVELLKKYYPVDTEKRIITYKLYYKHASEILDYTVGEVGKEMFNDEFLGKVSSLFNDIPLKYKADVILEIEDYDVYNEQIIMEKFNDMMELNSYGASRTSKKNSFTASLLILVGCALLIVNALISTYNVLGSGTLFANVFKETMDITSWVFIWQAVTVLFLTPGEKKQWIINLIYKLNSFSIARDGKIIVCESTETISQKCHIDNSFTQFQKRVLSITATLLIFESVVMLIGSLSTIDADSLTTHEWHQKMFEVVLAACTLFDGCLALTKFTNHHVDNIKFIIASVVTYTVLVAYFLHNSIVNHSWSIMLNQIFLIVLITVTFAICFFWDKLKIYKIKNKK